MFCFGNLDSSAVYNKANKMDIQISINANMLRVKLRNKFIDMEQNVSNSKMNSPKLFKNRIFTSGNRILTNLMN